MIADILLKVAGMEQDFWQETYRPRPSAAGHCLRALVYRRMGLKPDPWPDRTIVVFDDGQWHEELTIEWLSKTAYQIHDRQMKVTCGEVAGQPLVGHIDGIIEDALGRQWLLEHKAINHFSFQRYLTRIEQDVGLDKDDPYYVQVQLYLNSPELREMDINEAVLLIKNKNTGHYCEFIVPYDPPVAVAAIEKLNEVERCAAEARIPDRPYNRDVDWQCSYCRYERRCWEGYEGERVGPVETDDAELAELVRRYHECAEAASSAAKQREEVKRALVHRLDALKLREARVAGYTVRWIQRHRKGYEVKPGTYYQLTVSKPKEG